MNIYEEAARRYGGGVFRFPDCPECGGGYLSVRHVSSFSRAAPSGYHCDNCKHRWPKLTHRQMAQAMYEAWGNDRAESERQAMDVKRAHRPHLLRTALHRAGRLPILQAGPGGVMSRDNDCPCSNCGSAPEHKHGLCRSCHADAKEDERQDRMDQQYDEWRDGE